MTLAFLKPPVIVHTNVELKRYYEYELTEHERVEHEAPAVFAVIQQELTQRTLVRPSGGAAKRGPTLPT